MTFALCPLAFVVRPGCQPLLNADQRRGLQHPLQLSVVALGPVEVTPADA